MIFLFMHNTNKINNNIVLYICLGQKALLDDLVFITQFFVYLYTYIGKRSLIAFNIDILAFHRNIDILEKG
jgi:hypothetical protein